MPHVRSHPHSGGGVPLLERWLDRRREPASSTSASSHTSSAGSSSHSSTMLPSSSSFTHLSAGRVGFLGLGRLVARRARLPSEGLRLSSESLGRWPWRAFFSSHSQRRSGDQCPSSSTKSLLEETSFFRGTISSWENFFPSFPAPRACSEGSEPDPSSLETVPPPGGGHGPCPFFFLWKWVFLGLWE